VIGGALPLATDSHFTNPSTLTAAVGISPRARLVSIVLDSLMVAIIAIARPNYN